MPGETNAQLEKRKSNTAAPSVDPPRLVRLSDPQKRLLANLAAGDTAAPGYKPAEKLIGYGLAEIREGKWSGDRVIISDAGRSYFEANADVDLPDTAAQDSASKSNNPAVSG